MEGTVTRVSGRIKYYLPNTNGTKELKHITVNNQSYTNFSKKNVNDIVIFKTHQETENFSTAVVITKFDSILVDFIPNELSIPDEFNHFKTDQSDIFNRLEQIINIVDTNYIIGLKEYNQLKVETSPNNEEYVYDDTLQVDNGTYISFIKNTGYKYGKYISTIALPDQHDTFDDRVKITNTICSKLNKLFTSDIEIVPFGVENILSTDSVYKEHIRNIRNTTNNVNSMIEFSPDYVLFNKENNKSYFLEVKASLTPCWSNSKINDIHTRHEDITIDRIGEMAREPHLAYKRFYPDSIVIMGTSYNSDILLAQFAKNIRCLRCDTNNSEHENCNQCPATNDSFFNCNYRYNNGGSGTPNTNIDLSSFMEIHTFFAELGIQLNNETVELIKTKIKDSGLDFKDEKTPKEKQYDIAYKLKNLHSCDYVILPNIPCNCGGTYTYIDNANILTCSNCHRTKESNNSNSICIN